MIEKLHEEFIASSIVSFFPQYKWPIEDDSGICPDPAKYPGLNLTYRTCEALLVEKETVFREFVIVGAFPDEQRLSIRWCGEDAQSMKNTGKALCLPSSSGNLGETVFRIFVGHLEMRTPIEPREFAQLHSSELSVIRKIQEEEGIYEAGVCFTQDISADKENELRLVIAKLIHIYEGGVIDKRFYHEWQSRRTSHST